MKLFFIALSTFLCVISTLLFFQWYSFHLPYWLSNESGKVVYFIIIILTLIFEVMSGTAFFHKDLNSKTWFKKSLCVQWFICFLLFVERLFMKKFFMMFCVVVICALFCGNAQAQFGNVPVPVPEESTDGYPSIECESLEVWSYSRC